jgi:hypothetical protein
MSDLERNKVDWWDDSIDENMQYKESTCSIRPDRNVEIQELIDQGYTVLYPADNQLFIDIDSEEDLSQYDRMLNRLLAMYPEITWSETASKSGFPCSHIIVTLPFPISPTMRIALQAALGSDPMRELLSSIRVLQEIDNPTIFLERSNKNGQTECTDS